MGIFDVAGAALDDIQGLAGFLTNPFGPPVKDEWNLIEGSFKNDTTNTTTVFWVANKDKAGNATGISQATDGGGRRLAIYEYPYRDGQSVEDLGRKGERFSFEIKFFGEKYKDRLDEFIRNVTKGKGRGKLSHPVRGIVSCRFQEWEFIHRYDEWSSVSIRATFIEDNQVEIAALNSSPASINMSLRGALQAITDAQAFISGAIFKVTALLLLPNAIKASLLARLNSIGGQMARLFGQIAATFASDARISSLALQAENQVNGFLNLYSAVITSASKVPSLTGTTTIPPVYQVGFSPSDQATINKTMSQFVSANTITPQQAVFSANEIRGAITSAVAETREILGNDGYEIELAYRDMSIQIQMLIESAISAANALVKVYVVPTTMSLRMVAFKNGLDKDRQNEIERLNPFLSSVNYIESGTHVIVPAS